MRLFRVPFAAFLLLGSVLVAPAAAGPADALPLTFGTYAGWMDCDTGWCGGELQLQGRFGIGQGGSLVTTATLEWDGRDDVDAWQATIIGPRFEGICRVSREQILVPGVALQYAMGAACSVVVDGGASGGGVWFNLVDDPNVDLSDVDPHRTGRILPTTNVTGLSPL